jgi:4'-phosphopantetheinyl transferase
MQILLHHATLPRSLAAEVEARWLAALPAARRQRLGRFRQAEDRLATLAGLALLQDCARAAGHAPPSPGALAWLAGGKPVWPDGPDFSISHAAGRVGCALAPPGLRVGLDLEGCGAVQATALRRVLQADEWALACQSGADATALWVAKEAVLKAAGSTIAAAAEVAVAADHAMFAGERWRLLRPTLAPSHVAAVACERDSTLAIACRDIEALLAAGP